jgi:hypothetical protein
MDREPEGGAELKKIPNSINSWEKSRIAEFYIDDLRWNLTPLKEQSKEPLFPRDRRYELSREDLLAHLGKGANIGLFPAGSMWSSIWTQKRTAGKASKNFWPIQGPTSRRFRESAPQAEFTFM